MKIVVIDDSVKNPVELKESKEFSYTPTGKIKEYIEAGKLWHFIAWSNNEKIGFSHKGKVLSLNHSHIKSVAINYVEPAKGDGWVSLVVILLEANGYCSLIESSTYSEKALNWFLENKKTLENLFNKTITINDRGKDY